ncbi:MAG TPA: phage holin family protein [Ferruginibacter sp.]|nr:phage holin family protein [Ferruginibacter sp.]
MVIRLETGAAFDMEKAFQHAERLVDQFKSYVNTRLQAWQLSLAEKAASIIANVLAAIFCLMVLLLFVVMLSIGAALLLGEWLGHYWLGFLIIAFIYLFMGIVFWSLRKKLIQFPLMNVFLQQLIQANDEKDTQS